MAESPSFIMKNSRKHAGIPAMMKKWNNPAVRRIIAKGDWEKTVR